MRYGKANMLSCRFGLPVVAVSAAVRGHNWLPLPLLPSPLLGTWLLLLSASSMVGVVTDAVALVLALVRVTLFRWHVGAVLLMAYLSSYIFFSAIKFTVVRLLYSVAHSGEPGARYRHVLGGIANSRVAGCCNDDPKLKMVLCQQSCVNRRFKGQHKAEEAMSRFRKFASENVVGKVEVRGC